MRTVSTNAAKAGKLSSLFMVLALIASVLILLYTATESPALAWARAWLLMPVLAMYVLAAVRQRAGALLWWLLTAQLMSWLGDIALALPDDAMFIVGVGFFLLAQVAYIVTFTRIKGRHLVGQKPWLAVPYLLYFAAMMAVVVPTAAELLPAVAVYGAVLVTMALMALDASGRVAPSVAPKFIVGSILFVISDSLIALTNFGPIPSSNVVGVVLLGTYCAAQILLAWGFVQHLNACIPTAQDGLGQP